MQETMALEGLCAGIVKIEVEERLVVGRRGLRERGVSFGSLGGKGAEGFVTWR